MSITQEMFRFVSVRRPDRAVIAQLNNRLIRDLRKHNKESLLEQLFGSGDFTQRLRRANQFADSDRFVDEDDLAMLALEPAIDFFRRKLEPGVDLEQLAADFIEEMPDFGRLLRDVPPDDIVKATILFIARLWDTLYAQTIRGFDRYVTTNYAADGLRVYHVLRLLWLSHRQQLTTWQGGRFDDYELIIDVEAAAKVVGQGADPGAALGNPATFRTGLDVGAIKPPSVGDLILVEQELRCYEEGESADIINIMRGERRERTIRDLTRTTETTTIETLTESEEFSSVSTDERFTLSSEAQNTASKSFGLSAGVNVSGKYGPVQINASVNASYNTSQSSTTSTAEEYAKTVTEEATKRVKNSIKETSSITILTEHQDTSLQGYNNEEGTEHITGIYRWVDKIYDARLMNYGRRLMFSFNVPEPAVFHRSLLADKAAAVMADLDEPIHPSRIGRGTVNPLPDTNPDGGFRSFQDLDEDNYARLAGYYDVTGLAPPPRYYLTGSKAIAYPDPMEAKKIDVHDANSDLAWVSSDNTLTVDEGYRVTQVAVFAPEGAAGGFTNFVDAVDMGEVASISSPGDGTETHEANVILVVVGNKSFYMTVKRDPNDGNKKIVNDNFNAFQTIDEDWHAFGDAIAQSLPISITCKFEGVVTFTVMYKAIRTDEAFDAWKSAAWATIMKGYNAKKQAYDQALALAEAQAESETEEQTFALRDDQYRAIELTEIKRGCIELLTEGTADGHTSIDIESDGTPRIVFDEAEGNQLDDWRPALANGAVAEFFEQFADWTQATYEFHPYYWAGAERWRETASASAADPIFEQFLRAGNATVVVPVRPGYERSALMFCKYGKIWGGGYLPLFNIRDVLDVYADVEQAEQLDPPVQIGDNWEIRLPTSLIILQEDGELPKFPAEESTDPDEEESTEPPIDETVPF